MNDEDGNDAPSTSNIPSLHQDNGNGSSIRARKAYAGSSGRQLSTSAAKRQSVMALGSIRHLQHRYAKTGLASSNLSNLGTTGRSLPLALPGQVLTETDNTDLPEEDFPLPPSPPAQLSERSLEPQLPSSRVQREAVYQQLADVCDKWGLVEMDKPTSSSRRDTSIASTTPSGVHYDRSSTTSPTPSEPLLNESLVLTLMNSTTSAIRAAQKYFLTIPPDRLSSSEGIPTETMNVTTASTSARGFPALGVVTASRPIPRHSSVGVAASRRQHISPERHIQATSYPSGSRQDPLARLRKSSLATLGALKEMEHRYRLNPEEQTNIEDLSDSMNNISIMSSITDLSQSHSNFQVDGSTASERSAYSDVSRGHLYRNNISLENLHKEAQIVKEWVETVNDLLTHVQNEGKIVRIRTKSGNLESSPIPKWARVDLYNEEELARVVACLDVHLPADLRAELHRDDPSLDIFLRLSDGQMLCTAYNAVLRKSEKPWGFIPRDSIHDVISLMRERQLKEQAERRSSVDESGHLQVGGSSSTSMRRVSSEGLSGDDSVVINNNKSRIGLTFRRLENLRVFVAAIKLRYSIQLSQNIDLRIIARKEEGWREMITEIASKWVEAAAYEKRNEETDSD